eukprot:TRINITY_DN13860_c0_g1_i1.p1 TRINITY_DN13860_c0_g1~~TRINITY_DN13860_c0_g1_i1.p1  ORF type:complete len:181 (-),score=21.61 TRINITY_DN13860_c0_g1_i1:479-1021(-)
MWSIDNLQKERDFLGHTETVGTLRFSPDSKTIASGSDDHTIRIFSVIQGVCQHELKDHSGSVRSVCFSPDGTMLASGSEDKTVRLWNIESGYRCDAVLKGHKREVRAVAFHKQDSKILASGGSDSIIIIWNVSTSQCVRQLLGHSNWVTSLDFSPNGDKLASSSTDKKVFIWNFSTAIQL